jgi:hypothetical protein
MRTSARQTRENRTITIDFQDEATGLDHGVGHPSRRRPKARHGPTEGKLRYDLISLSPALTRVPF